MVQERSAKEDLPSPREYRCLRRAAQKKVSHAKRDDEEFRLECTFLLRVMGELGLRAGELTHLCDEWVDFTQNEIQIPEYDECTFGNDGGPCGYCKKQARQMAKKNDDISYEVALRDQWSPKGGFAARDVWFGYDESLIDLIDEYLLEFGHYTGSRASVNRRINTIAEECKLIEPEEVYPHALRGYAAKHHASMGVRAYQLQKYMGWGDISAVMDYVKMAPADVKSEMKRAHGQR